MFEMTLPKSFREQHLDQLSQNLFAAIAKQSFRLLIDQNNLAFDANNDNPVGRRLQKPTKLRLRSFCLCACKLFVVQFRTCLFDRGFLCADKVTPPYLCR